MTPPFADREALIEAARGGRVAHSGFLEPAAASRLRYELRAAGVAVTVAGGYPGARRRVVTAHPQHVPEAAPALAAWYLASADAASVREALERAPMDDRWRGDVRPHADGASVLSLDPPGDALRQALAGLQERAGAAEPEPVPVERVGSGTIRNEQVVVPSLRVDAVGAKGFRASRSWFTKGIAAGNVYLNGSRVAKGAEAEEGDEIWAEGLGWVRVERVEGETRRGNLKALLTVEKS